MNISQIVLHGCQAVATLAITAICIYAVSKGHDGATVYSSVAAIAALNGVTNFLNARNKSGCP